MKKLPLAVSRGERFDKNSRAILDAALVNSDTRVCTLELFLEIKHLIWTKAVDFDINAIFRLTFESIHLSKSIMNFSCYEISMRSKNLFVNMDFSVRKLQKSTFMRFYAHLITFAEYKFERVIF